MYSVLSAGRMSCRSHLLRRERPRRRLEDALQPRGSQQGSRPHLLHPAQPGRLRRLSPQRLAVSDKFWCSMLFVTTLSNMPSTVAELLNDLLQRSHRLGADRRFTNFAGGNTSAKLTLHDPVTGEPTRVLAVKGSGGDLATLTEAGLALLVLARVRALEQRYLEGVGEDDLVDAYNACRFGHGGAVPSIDTPLHAFVDEDHVDHLHPDSIIALAASADGERLVRECYGDEVGWLDWLRPGFRLGQALRDFRGAHPTAHGVVLGGHGMICWGTTSEECEANSRDLIWRAEHFLAQRGIAEPFGEVVDDMAPLPVDIRRAAAAQL